jgi:hypothetical protein
MQNNLNLKKIENRAFRSTYEDGLFDILIGFILSLFIFALLLGDLGLSDFWSSFVLLPIYLLFYLFFRVAKKQITIPRTGLMKIGSKRKSKMKKLSLFMSLLLLLGIISAISFWAYYQKEIIKWIAPGALIILMLSSFSVAGFLLSINRLFIYGIMIALLVPIGEILFWRGIVTHHGYPLVFGIASSTMIITGIVLLIRFVRKYPKEGVNGKI